MAIIFPQNNLIFKSLDIEEIRNAFNYIQANIGCTVDSLSTALDEIKQSFETLQGRMNHCENEVYVNLRPELDALTEKSNQKTDLEISEQKGTRRFLPIIEDRTISINTKNLDEWYEKFLKELSYEQQSFKGNVE